MQEYIVDCVRLSGNKIGKTSTKFVTDSPMNAIEKFITLYLLPIEEPDIYYGGLDWELNKFLSYKIKLKGVEDILFLLNCRYIGEKNKYAKTLP